MTRRLSDKLVSNTLFNAGGRLWQISISFFLTPYILHHIGIELFGVWALIGVLTGYLGLLDFGVGTSFGRYISEYYSLKKYESINQVLCAGILFYVLIAPVVLLGALLLFSPLLFISDRV